MIASKGDPSPLLEKSHSQKQKKANNGMSSFTTLQYLSLSTSTEISEIKTLSSTDLLEYIQDVLSKIYQQDQVFLRQTFQTFLKAKIIQLKSKLKERLSLLKYLQQSLMFKSFAQISEEINKQWRKNPLLYSISTIWSKCIITHQFKSKEEFVQQYERYRTFIANISQHYFKNSLKLLNQKKVDTFMLILEDTSHKIINSLQDWKQIYNKIFTKLIVSSHKIIQSEQTDSFDFDLTKLRIKPNYLNLSSKNNQLQKTTNFIKQLEEETRIHEKISILKDIRTNLLAELTANSNRFNQGNPKSNNQFEKDDIIDCMIYCIIKGKIYNIGRSIKALILLLGKDNDLLAKKGVDSCRADIQGAAQYIQQELEKYSFSTIHSDS